MSEGVSVEKHPHACGEDWPTSGMTYLLLETPPRLWGRLATHRIKIGLCRKHPHACGEDLFSISTCRAWAETPPRLWGRHLPRRPGNQLSLETPPRLWGRRRRARFRVSAKGNTPTPVGKTARSVAGTSIPRKHPHACGEDPACVPMPLLAEETPPRLWGRPNTV